MCERAFVVFNSKVVPIHTLRMGEKIRKMKKRVEIYLFFETKLYFQTQNTLYDKMRFHIPYKMYEGDCYTVEMENMLQPINQKN